MNLIESFQACEIESPEDIMDEAKIKTEAGCFTQTGGSSYTYTSDKIGKKGITYKGLKEAWQCACD